MRSSKSRSRSKSNRSRSVGNIVNRVFDSSGPEGKVRGTPQQIIDKYGQLARDATLGNDRVAAENFQQHAEHYTRMLGDAQREMDAKREQQEAQLQAEREKRQQNQQNQKGGERGSANGQDDADPKPAAQASQADAMTEVSAAPDPIATDGDGDSGLVETPENKPAPKPRKPRTRKPRAPKADAADAAAAPKDDGAAAQSAEATPPKKAAKPKPQKLEGGPDVPEAAE